MVVATISKLLRQKRNSMFVYLFTVKLSVQKIIHYQK